MKTPNLRVSFLGAFFALITVSNVAMSEQPAQADPCGCFKVLEQQDQEASHAIRAEVAKHLSSEVRDDEKFFERFRSAGGGADALIPSVGLFSGDGGTESKTQSESRQKLWKEFEQFTREASDVAVQKRATAKEAIAAWRACMLQCIPPPAPLPGLKLTVEGDPTEQTVTVVVSWTSPAGYTGPAPKITAVRTYGLQNPSEIEAALKDKTLGVHPRAVRRQDRFADDAIFEIETNNWSGVTVILPKVRKGPDAEARWQGQQGLAAKFKNPLVASAGCFDDKIVVAWPQIDHKMFKHATKITVYWSVSPNDWDAQRSHDTGVHKLMIWLEPKRWEERQADNRDDPATPLAMPRGVPIYFRAGFTYRTGRGDEKKEHFFAPDPVAGWLPLQDSSGANAAPKRE